MILRMEAVREIIDDALVPWWTVSDQITDGIMRRCLVCGRCSEIMPGPTVAYVTHEPDCVVVTVNRELAARAARISHRTPEPRWQATAQALGHDPQPDGRCAHRWRNRTTVVVQCKYLDGFKRGMAFAYDRRDQDEYVRATVESPT